MYMYSISILPSYTSFCLGVSWSVYQYLYGYLQKLVDSVLSTLLQSLIVTYRHSYSDLSTLLQSLIDTHTFTHIHSYQLVEAIEYLNSISWNHFQSSCPFIIHSRKSINNYQMTILLFNIQLSNTIIEILIKSYWTSQY